MLGNIIYVLTSIGFDSYGFFRNDDTWLSEDKFVEILDELIGEKLYDHDQKKTLQRVDMGKESEDILTEIRNDI